jgi:hypothetical protein
MLSIQTTHSTSIKKLKWPLFFTLMVISILAYTNTSKLDKLDLGKLDQKTPVTNSKHFEDSKTKLILAKEIDLGEYQPKTKIKAESSGKPLVFNHEHSMVGLLSTEDKEKTEQTFKFPEEDEYSANNSPAKFKHLAKFNPNIGPKTTEYIQGISSKGAQSGANTKPVGESNNENKTEEDTSKENLAAVPVPPAIWLLGSAFLGFAGMRKRKNAD